jgi:hypothetical protein
MHLHFQSNQKKCKVRHGASNNIKYLGFFLHGKSKPNPARTFGKGQGLAREKEKEKVTPEFWRVKKRKNSTAKFGALQDPSPQPPLLAKWPPPESGQQIAALHPTLHHDIG